MAKLSGGEEIGTTGGVALRKYSMAKTAAESA